MSKQVKTILYHNNQISIISREQSIVLLSSDSSFFSNPENTWSSNQVTGQLHFTDNNGKILSKNQYFLTVEYPIIVQHYLDGTIDTWYFTEGGYHLKNDQ